MTKSFGALLHKKDRLHKKYIQKNNLLAKEKYLKIRNQYFHLIKQKKREYFKNKFKNYKHDKKKLGKPLMKFWEGLKQTSVKLIVS